jgi:hypothetical protein
MRENSNQVNSDKPNHPSLRDTKNKKDLDKSIQSL